MNAKKTPIAIAFDPEYIRHHPYRSLKTGEYSMGSDYRIVRKQGLADHLLLLTLDGRGVASGTELERGSLFVFAPGEPHDYGTSVPQWHFLWAHVHAPASWRQLLPPGKTSLESIPSAERRRIVAHFRSAVEHASIGSVYDEALAMNLLENALLRIWRYRNDIAEAGFVGRMSRHILEHASERLPVAELAKTAGLSPSRFAHRFRDAFGCTPQEYVENCRIEMAKRFLLTTSMSVKEIAYNCGFTDPLYFSKRFAKACGRPPSAWLR